MGDLNAKVGSDNTGYEQVMGRHGLGEMNENGELFANHCANHNLVIGGTVFPHKKCHLATWVSPDMNTENQIDHVCISKKFRRSLQDVRVKRGADAATDHHLIVANVKLKLKKHQNIESTGKRFNISIMQQREIISIEDHWQEIKNAFTTACETSVGLKNRKHQEWITPETLVKVEKRKNIKNILNNSKTRSAKQSASREYTIANKDVRNSARRDKRAFVDKLTAEAEEAARANNIKALYDNIKLLTGKYQKGSRPVKSKEGKTLNTHEEQMKRWVEHFKDVLNQDPPVRKADIPPSEELLAVDLVIVWTAVAVWNGWTTVPLFIMISLRYTYGGCKLVWLLQCGQYVLDMAELLYHDFHVIYSMMHK
ncbi:unnamed protein product [Mytilus edulis]|uniref:Endonuclease/exonuclease/phosphatase domain-containing protein n=1 Tax=Mytilus edulis TaxID=6550 RepID=A0A8S3VGQ5_MYTED|nr:unnamed protein product [Mytilus edulis]